MLINGIFGFGFIDVVIKSCRIKLQHKIHDQLRKLGCSLDWSNYVFTMEEKMQESVKYAFIDLYNKILNKKGWPFTYDRC